MPCYSLSCFKSLVAKDAESYVIYGASSAINSAEVNGADGQFGVNRTILKASDLWFASANVAP
jgi:hypothetical protein